MSKPVILTGLRANNNLHIGNYFGALLPLIDMAKTRSDEYQINLFVPDLHSFTTPIDHGQLQAQIWNNLRMFVAAGLPLDNPDIHVYRQSYVPAHSELTWIFDNFTGFGEMSRMTQFKDKSAKLEQDRISVGLFNYPVLMAADILLYGASYVPVGDDQSQHLEFARDIAIRLNNQFGELFTVPAAVKDQHEFFGKEQGLRIKDLVDPSKKMSKSDDSGRGIIFLSDSPDEAAKKIMSATTDSEGAIRFDFEKQPGVSNLIQIQSLLRNQPLDETIRHWEGKNNYGDLKREVAEAVKEFLSNFQARHAEVNETELHFKLQADELEMNTIANQTLLNVQKAVGLRSADATTNLIMPSTSEVNLPDVTDDPGFAEDIAAITSWFVTPEEIKADGITRVEVYTPSAHNTVTGFTYNGQRYYLFNDYSAGDNPEYIESELKEINHTLKGSICPLKQPGEYTYTAHDQYLWNGGPDN